MSRFALLAVILAVPVSLSAQRPTGVVGEYVAPRTWPQGQHNYDLVHQRIAVQFNETQRLVTGEVTTTVVPMEATDTIRLNAENLTIDRATDVSGNQLQFSSDTAHVTVQLGRRAPAGDTVVFTIAYHTNPERGIYFVPRRHVVWSQGEATETRAWVPTYDHPNDKTTWEMLVTADSSLKVLSNGTLVEVTPTNGGAQKVWHWSQSQPASTYLYSVVVGPFTVLYDRWRDKPVDYWVYPDTVDAGWRAFGETPSMIELYTRLLDVPYPWDKYDQSAIPDFTYGGMENASATTQTDDALAGPGNDPPGARGLVAHELAHQWFGDYTTTANWANAWLNEGLTTYMASVHTEKTRGWGAAQLDWWGQQQQAMRADRNPRPLVWGEVPGNDPIQLFFSGHVYPKGAQVAHQLRRLLGDETFWAGMHRFLVDNAHRPVTTADYAVAFEKTCNCDLDWFFDQWVYGIGYPQLEVSHEWDPQRSVLSMTVEQTQPVDSLHPLFRFPVTLRMTTPDAVLRAEITISNELETFEMKLPAEPLSFRFDEGGWLLGSVHTDQTTAELASIAKHDLDVSARIWALQALAESTEDVAVAARRFIVLNEHEAQLRAMALTQIATLDSTVEATTLARAALRDPDGAVRRSALALLARRAPEETSSIALNLYQSDPNPAVRSAALNWYGRLAGNSAIPILIEATKAGGTGDIRATAASALGRTRDPQVIDALAQLIDPQETRSLRQTALRSIAAVGDTARTMEFARRSLTDYDPLFARTAVQVLAQLKTPAARAQLEEAERSETRVHVKAEIARALAGGS